MDLAKNNDVFELMVNSQNFFKLPYRYDLTTSTELANVTDVKIIFDDIKMHMPVHWNNLEFVQRMFESFGGLRPQFTLAEVTIKLGNIASVNEIYDAIAEFSNEK